MYGTVKNFNRTGVNSVTIISNLNNNKSTFYLNNNMFELEVLFIFNITFLKHKLVYLGKIC